MQSSLDRIYSLGDPPDYEPTDDRTIAALAAADGVDPLEKLYDVMLEHDAQHLLMLPFFNYVDRNHDAIREMLLHPAGVSGLSDGGAHCFLICDASIPTFMLTHWARDRYRGEQLPLDPQPCIHPKFFGIINNPNQNPAGQPLSACSYLD